MTSVLIADDHPIVLEGLSSLLERTEMTVIARCRSGGEVFDALARLSPDIVVLDVNMPAPGGLEVAARLKELERGPKIVLLSSSFAEGQIDQAIALNVEGIVLKETASQQLLACLDVVRDGRRWFDPEVTRRTIQNRSHVKLTAKLTPRELDVVRLVARGLRNKEVARQLGITEGTVKMYLHSVYDKLGIGSRFELMSVFNER